jgi:hypothetical protein
MAWREFHQEQSAHQHLLQRVDGLATQANQLLVEPDYSS